MFFEVLPLAADSLWIRFTQRAAFMTRIENDREHGQGFDVWGLRIYKVFYGFLSGCHIDILILLDQQR